MGLQINTGLTTVDGGTVASGAHVIFSTRFPFRGLNYSVEILIYRSEAALNSGLSDVKVSEITSYFYTKQLTTQEFTDLTPIVIHDDVKAFLEGFVGVGNVVVIL